MNAEQKFNLLQKKYPHPHIPFFARPPWSRRQFFQVLGAGISGHFLMGPFTPEVARAQSAAAPKGTAKQIIFIFLPGAPSHVDMFDFKRTPSTPLDAFQPATVNGIDFPVGLLPATAQVLDKISIVRSGLAWALAHNLAQTWSQIGRNPTSPTGKIAPHIGSVAAIELDALRRPDQIFPAFIALNSGGAPGAGYFPVEFGPFRTEPSAEGLANTTHPAGQPRFQSRFALLQNVDAELRGPESPMGDLAKGFGGFYERAQQLMYNPTVANAFNFSEEESARYGNSGFGNACAIAKKVVAADQGTRFIQISLGGWDHHEDIYDPQAARSIFVQGGEFDAGFGALISDLDSDGLLDETLVVVAGEFGRTVGRVTNERNGRDHYLQQFFVFAGGGTTGGKVIGETDETGAFTEDPGWSRFRNIRVEDVEATCYSALGINWTTVRYDDPLGRGFEYVPLSGDDVYGPIHELWEA